MAIKVRVGVLLGLRLGLGYCWSLRVGVRALLGVVAMERIGMGE